MSFFKYEDLTTYCENCSKGLGNKSFELINGKMVCEFCGHPHQISLSPINPTNSNEANFITEGTLPKGLRYATFNDLKNYYEKPQQMNKQKINIKTKQILNEMSLHQQHSDLDKRKYPNPMIKDNRNRLAQDIRLKRKEANYEKSYDPQGANVKHNIARAMTQTGNNWGEISKTNEAKNVGNNQANKVARLSPKFIKVNKR